MNPETREIYFDTYDYYIADIWMEDFKRDFPDGMHFITVNEAYVMKREREKEQLHERKLKIK